MKKIVLAIMLTIAGSAVFAQERVFTIKPRPITDTAHKFVIKPVAFDKDSMLIYYRLSNQTRLIEEGNRKVPIAFLNILTEYPVDTAKINPVLATWGLSVIKQDD